MDTNQKNNTQHVNSFAKGMNSDTSLDMVNAEQYVFGLNIRITNNTSIGGNITPNTKENVVTPITEGAPVDAEGDFPNTCHILATASVGDLGAVIVREGEESGLWSVFKVTYDQNTFTYTRMFTSSKPTTKDKFSVVINKELTDCTKLYISDGMHPLMQINLDEEPLDGATEDDLISSYIFPTNKVNVVKRISGQLKTQLLQYTYRFYKRHGICSKMAPLTNKIQVISNVRNKELGNAEDTATEIGFKLSINTENYSNLFDHIQIYRISFVKHNQLPEVNLICDNKLNSSVTEFIFDDTGKDSLLSISLDEFDALNNTTIIPNIIEQCQNVLFAANVEDKTVMHISAKDYDAKAYLFNENGEIILYSDSTYSESRTYTDVNNIDEDYYINAYSDINDTHGSECMFDEQGYFGGTGKNISWRFVTCRIPLDCTKYSVRSGTVPPPSVDQKVLSTISNSFYNKLFYINEYGNCVDSGKTIQDYLNDKQVYCESTDYNNLITSSLFRSLKRDEVYRYGIVFYTSLGNRSDVLWIADIRTPSAKQVNTVVSVPTESSDFLEGFDPQTNILFAQPIGIEFNVNLDNLADKGIVGYEIVRCEKTQANSKNLLQVVLSRPSCLYKNEDGAGQTRKHKSPYFPNVFLTTLFIATACRRNSFNAASENYYDIADDPYRLLGTSGDFNFHINGKWTQSTNVNNFNLFQIFSPQINVTRVDELQKLSQNNIFLHPICYISDLNNVNCDSAEQGRFSTKNYEDWIGLVPTEFCDAQTSETNINFTVSEDGSEHHLASNGLFLVLNKDYDYSSEKKQDTSPVIRDYFESFVGFAMSEHRTHPTSLKFDSIEIKAVADVMNPTWEQGFSNLQFNGSDIISATKSYKSYTSMIDNARYTNWVCNGMYDFPATEEEAKSMDWYDSGQESYDVGNEHYSNIVDDSCALSNEWRSSSSSLSEQGYKTGFIGPGPVCFVLKLDNYEHDNVLHDNILGVLLNSEDAVSANDTYKYTLGTIKADIQHSASLFAGLGKFEKQYDTYCSYGNFTTNDNQIVFDGDIYITPCEFVNMFKAYNFNDFHSIMSTQMVYYIPMESTINTCFDYGMNYRNTSNKNLQLTKGEITGISTQTRPLHQYNMIYSDNQDSIVKYTAQTEEDVEEKFPQRIYYSLLKTNGENIDNWHTFKPIDFIDADSRYGEITQLLSSNNTLYYWLNNAFGKLSVNERSLITDQNSNTIQLGQGGVLQRVDYIDTRYGMQPDQLCSIAVDGSVFWIDTKNKAVVAGNSEKVVNYGEMMNVQNIINSRFSDIEPCIDYDLQNMELLCKTLTNGDQLVFSLKNATATSIYTRRYTNTLTLNNTLYGLKNDGFGWQLNYNSNGDGKALPTELQFVVNAVPQYTKTFDNQSINIVNHTNDYDNKEFKTFSFATDICRPTTELKLIVTDREGNIECAIPREDNCEYGNRMKGKWMKVTIKDDQPSKDFAISHIITKFRYSFI